MQSKLQGTMDPDVKPGIFVSADDVLWISSLKSLLWLFATDTQRKLLSQDSCWQWLLQAGFICLFLGTMSHHLVLAGLKLTV